MGPIIIFTFITLLVLWAAHQAWLGRPELNQQRYHVRSHIVDVEPLDPKDVFRSHPYWVTIHPVDAPNLGIIPEGEALAGQRPRTAKASNVITCRPPDLNMGMAREALGGHIALDMWISSTDPQDVRFTQPGRWNSASLVRAIIIILTVPVVLTGALVNRDLLEDANGLNLVLYLSGLTLAAVLVLNGAYFLVRVLTHWMSSLGSPLQVEARITGIVEQIKHSTSQMGLYVHVMYRPRNLPVQYGQVRLRALSRRQLLVLKKLVEKQLEDEKRGIVRVPVQHHGPPVTKTTTIVTESGPTNITVTRLESNDPRLHPQPSATSSRNETAWQRAATRAARKREKALKKDQERWRAKAQKELQHSLEHTVQWGSAAMQQLLEAGPCVWYMPLEPAVPHLVGVSPRARSTTNTLLIALGWILVVACGLALGIYLIWVNPSFLFPASDLPPSNQMPLGPWK